MRLILRDYLANLKERNELDTLLPMLLAQMGLRVFSRPEIGNRQNGVDIAAVGSINNEDKKVYLFSIKKGDLGRSDWNGNPQTLKPSLDEIIINYISKIPQEYTGLPIVICICLGGIIKQTVREDVTSYTKFESSRNPNISFEEWDGEQLSIYIEQYFLKEELINVKYQPLLRKSLAMVEEPQTSYKFFSELLDIIVNAPDNNTIKNINKSLRQINISLNILIYWCENVNNIESAYLSCENTLLKTWDLIKEYSLSTKHNEQSVLESFVNILITYKKIQIIYSNKILVHSSKLYALSLEVRPSSDIDVNLVMFDVLGRIGIDAIWYLYDCLNISRKSNVKIPDENITVLKSYDYAIRELITNNPVLYTPLKDDQIIDISIAVFYLMWNSDNLNFIHDWLSEIIELSTIAYQTDRKYPCLFSEYYKLIQHPKSSSKEYKEKSTSASILYPTIAFLASIIEYEDIYKSISSIKKELFQHSNFQIWFPDENSDAQITSRDKMHGYVVSDVPLELKTEDFKEWSFKECQHFSFNDFSLVKAGLWPLIIVACRVNRLPLPPQVFKMIYDLSKATVEKA